MSQTTNAPSHGKALRSKKHRIVSKSAVKATRAVPAPKGGTTRSRASLLHLDASGNLVIERVAKSFGMSKTQIVQTAGLNPSVTYRPARLRSPKNQNRVREMLEVIGRVSEWAGGKDQAMAWYRAEPLPAFGGRTAESLVKDGKAAAVRDYLDSVAMGGFA